MLSKTTKNNSIEIKEKIEQLDENSLKFHKGHRSFVKFCKKVLYECKFTDISLSFDDFINSSKIF